MPYKAQLRSERLVLALIVVFLLFFVGGISLVIRIAYDVTQQTARSRAVSAADVVKTNADWVFEVSRQILQRIDDYVVNDVDELPSNAQAFMKHAVGRLPGFPRIYLVGADGQTRLTNDAEFKPIDIRDRPYFKELAEGAPQYVSSMLISRLNGKQIFVISRRIERNGKFVGAAIISFDSDLLRSVWQSLNLSPRSTVSFIRTDGEIVSRYPLPPGPQNVRNSPLFKESHDQSPRGTYETVSVTDDVRRIVAYQRLDSANLIAVASVDHQTAFAPFKKFRNALIGVAVPVGLLLLWLAIYSLRRISADTARGKQLEEALAANQLMLREIHHRIKNNLQAVLSLIRLQPLEPEAKQALSSRLMAMMAVHEQIYSRDQFLFVNASKYIRDIGTNVVKSYDNEISLRFDLDDVEVDRDIAMPLGLIVNEVVSNAAKHAFTGQVQPEISVELKAKSDGRAQLTIQDNGVGFDPDIGAQGMGRKLIEGFAAQLQGSPEYYNANGTKFVVRFPLVAPGRISN